MIVVLLRSDESKSQDANNFIYIEILQNVPLLTNL